ncbi:MAG: RidA family protein [Chloroflexi bacterium]|nr:RidA family protein [Chloroflexota bacterium]MDA1173580.1 RidA family protein [Chloroflexota bacterium]
MAKEMIVPNPDRKPAGFAPATKVGNMVFVSGQTGTGDNGLVSGAVREQTQQTFKNLETVLNAAGATMADVVKITCFLVRENDYKGYAEERLRAFSPDSQPASSTLIVKALAKPEFLVEIEAIAVIS